MSGGHDDALALAEQILLAVDGDAAHAVETGHEGVPVMPGVLIIEAMAQACAMLAFARMGGERDPEKLFYFASIDNARFKRVVIPGDQLRFECTFLREKLGMIKMHCDATVDGQLAACADMMCSYRSPK